MRGSIDAAEYKDFILGFIFWKFLSENELSFLRDNDWEDEDIKSDLNEENEADAAYIKERLGYFIPYEGLYSTWIDPDFDFDIDKVVTALNSFRRNVSSKYAHVYDGIFDTLSVKLSKLGENAAKRSHAALSILALIDPIPVKSDDGYDVLGYIYEYLISNFAAGAGKKAGEFYTPHEVSQLMSDIVAWTLRDEEEISIYDPTSGSASLLLNIGQAIERHNEMKNAIKYYAQEKIEATYNLTRMNLVMKGINPANIVTRRADTLEDDWPVLSDSDEPLRVNACVSNPPYSQKWKPKGRETDPRFVGYGLAPKSKADYAFLLHNLYHLRPGGVMTIVLPHGVLFRGGSEGEIRRKLVEEGMVDAIIGLPANIFFGTGIPTIVMVLRKGRPEDDVLIIDASRGFVKDGKKNRLRSRDIRRAFDAYVERKDVEGFCRVVSKAEIAENDWNLNIPRYVDSSEAPESWDVCSTMLGGIPETELARFSEWWEAMPGLRDALYEDDGIRLRPRSEDLSSTVRGHASVKAFLDAYAKAWDGFDEELSARLVEDTLHVHPVKDEEAFVESAFERMRGIPLVDPYETYQKIDDMWSSMVSDLEVIQGEGLAAITAVDENLVMKKKESKEYEAVDKDEPWKGRILPFELVQSAYFQDVLDEIASLEADAASAVSELESLVGELDAEEREGAFVKEDAEEFDFKEVPKAIDELYAMESDEIATLLEYKAIGTSKDVKPARLAFVEENPDVEWSAMKASGGCYSAKAVDERIASLRKAIVPDESSLIARLERAVRLNEQRKEAEKAAKARRIALQQETKERLESLSEQEALGLLREKWIGALMSDIMSVPDDLVADFVTELEKLGEKYAVTFGDVDRQIEEASAELADLLSQLVGPEDDMRGVRELVEILKNDR